MPWTRRQLLAALAAAPPTAALLSACGPKRLNGSFDGRVLVVGAGVAGMTAAHVLRQNGVDVRLLEAGSAPGGRVKLDRSFADFPIPLGAEWIHVERDILDEIVNDPDVTVATETVGYDADDPSGSFDGELTVEPTGSFADLKFVDAGWLDVFETYVLPGLEGRIETGAQVVSIDSSGERIQVGLQDGRTESADRVIVTVPISVLRRGDIAFTPALSPDRTDVLANATVWGGLKAFIRFSEAFYPTFLSFPDSETDDGQRLYFDAAYGQNTEQHVLGLFAVGQQAEAYQQLSGDTLRDYILAELDEVFDGAATPAYQAHIVQDWSAEPFIGAAYLADVASPATSRALSEAHDGRVHFAGEAYTSFMDWGGAHAAVRSALEAAGDILGG